MSIPKEKMYLCEIKNDKNCRIWYATQMYDDRYQVFYYGMWRTFFTYELTNINLIWPIEKKEEDMINYVSLIDKINKNFLEKAEGSDLLAFFEENPPLELYSIGSAHLIRYFGTPIWNSEDPTLIPNKLATIEEYLLTEIKKANEMILGLLMKEPCKGECVCIKKD